MNIENQVCSLEYAKKLLTLGVKQNSYFYWCCLSNIPQLRTNLEFQIGCDYSAFTASELFDILPHRITLKECEPFNSFRLSMQKSIICKDMNNVDKFKIAYTYIINYECDSTEMAGEDAWFKRQLFTSSIWDISLVNAAAKTLIHLIENGYIKHEK